VCFTTSKTVKTYYLKSRVKFKKLSSTDIENYIATGSPYDKAGGYGIQDNCVVESYTGSYENIMGLPVNELKKWLKL
jgi:septum formation protein